MPVQLTITGSYKGKDQTVFYAISVAADEALWNISKRYTDFVNLDEELGRVSGISRVALPEKGLFGFRKALNIGNFNENRQQGLQAYLSNLAAQLQSLRQLPALAQWCGTPAQQPYSDQATPGVVQAQPAQMQSAQPVQAEPVQAQAVQAPSHMVQPGMPQLGVGQPVAVMGQPAMAQPAMAPAGMAQPGMGAMAAASGLGALIGAATAAVAEGFSHGGQGGFGNGGFSTSTEQRCFKCEGRGFCHDSSMPHDCGPSEKCFFCETCSGCKGLGHIPGGVSMGGMGGFGGFGGMGGMGGSGSEQRCFKCEGRGFCHNSSMPHDCGPSEKCFFCETCSGCNGSGHIPGGVSMGGMDVFGGFGGMSQRCYKCSGNGFCHDSSMPHSAADGERCFFCTSCTGCEGKGYLR